MTVERSLLPGSNQHGGACEALREARCTPAEPKLAAELGERGPWGAAVHAASLPSAWSALLQYVQLSLQ